jgi:hypothetical protein
MLGSGKASVKIQNINPSTMKRGAKARRLERPSGL